MLKSALQLGLNASLLYTWYRFKLRSGLLRRQTPISGQGDRLTQEPQPLLAPPQPKDLRQVLGNQAQELIDEAEEILNGQVRIFGKTTPLAIDDHTSADHWTSYIDEMPDGRDIKLVWEIGRLGWATTLARTFILTRNERYAEGFWRYVEEFLGKNPPNQGPHWSSAQEVALRLISLAFCFCALNASTASTASRQTMLATSMAAHAERIPPTLAYARAQNNNHLLSEAMGLYTAAAMLPKHPKTGKWRRQGRKYYIQGILTQINANGAYAQHSSNYHRLMLQLALWADLLAGKFGERWPASVHANLAVATRWLLVLLDREGGEVPNLGPNDGAYILPLTVLPFNDYRPVVQAAARVFLGQSPLPGNAGDEMSIWLAPETGQPTGTVAPDFQPLRLNGERSWAALRTAQFKSRPGHADQLHLDLWWRGINLALDAGTYRYNAAPPWDNALAVTRAHNTISVNSQDQMTRASRFLWLDWAQARILERQEQDGHLKAVTAEHDGYRRFGLTHRRSVRVEADAWIVQDDLLAKVPRANKITARLHWLLPDWQWDLNGGRLVLQSPHGEIVLSVEADKSRIWLLRAGELVSGEGEIDPILGWYSPTYDLKLPALSLVVELIAFPPIRFRCIWSLPG